MFEHVSRQNILRDGGVLAPPLARLLRKTVLVEEQDDKQDVIEDESSSISESVVEPPEAPIIPPSIPSGRTTRQGPQDKEGQFLFHLQHKIPSNLWKKFSWRGCVYLKYYQEKGIEAGPVRRWSAQLHAYTYKTSTTTG
ncbi:hypothetical protein EVAR_33544_1 [Eumeta japonica]|uniref:Uncharacterized protein n=1 Tax=Eumeta variegata TaxID=151549 RepID=A0A4C1VLN3_EUMVA|nr:hypothetical protein EVAR_33544_1 [Eumeta japonica]